MGEVHLKRSHGEFFIMAITAPARVRNRIQAAEGEISDAVLNEFIADEQAFVEAYAQKAFVESDPQFGLARSICTDRCAAKALLFINTIPQCLFSPLSLPNACVMATAEGEVVELGLAVGGSHSTRNASQSFICRFNHDCVRRVGAFLIYNQKGGEK